MGTIADKLNKLLDTKSSIRNAIASKGIEIPENTLFSNYASKISQIPTGPLYEIIPITIEGSDLHYGSTDIYYTGIYDGKIRKFVIGEGDRNLPFTINVLKGTAIAMTSYSMGSETSAIQISGNCFNGNNTFIISVKQETGSTTANYYNVCIVENSGSGKIIFPNQ